MVRNRNLVFSLFYKGRINTKKYTIIGLRDRRISEWHIEQLYRINANGVIVLRVDEDILFESETRNYKWRWSGVVNIIKRYASSVVTIISMDNASMNTRNKIISSLHGIALIKFYDQEYKGESAVDCFCEIARQNGTNAPESEIGKIRNSDRTYSKRSLQTIYSDWYNEYVATVQFPEYTAYFNGKGGEDDTLNEKNAYDKLSEMIGLGNVKKSSTALSTISNCKRNTKSAASTLHDLQCTWCFRAIPARQRQRLLVFWRKFFVTIKC